MIPLPLSTARLTLELPDPSNTEDLAAHLAFVSLGQVARMLARVPHPYPQGELPRRYSLWRRAYEQDEDDLVFIVREQASGRLVGSCGFSLEQNRRRLEPGYVFAPEVWGRGYATEALAALLAAGLRAYPSVEQVEAPHFADNPASGRVMEKVGLRFDRDEIHACIARAAGEAPAKVFVLPDDSPLWALRG